MILYYVQCCALHWTDNKNFHLGAMFIMYFCAVFLSHVHTTFWLGIEQCCNWRRNLVPDESDPRFAWNTYQKLAPETKESIYGTRFLEHMSWVLEPQLFDLQADRYRWAAYVYIIMITNLETWIQTETAKLFIYFTMFWVVSLSCDIKMCGKSK